jgi:hypothetical protein
MGNGIASGDLPESRGSSPAPEVTVSGSLNGERFESISDADPRVGPRLEVIAAGQYTWVPFAHLSEVAIEPPKRLRDLLWPTARIKAGPGLKDFEFGEVIVPAVAPLSWEHPSGSVRLGREVDWLGLPDGDGGPPRAQAPGCGRGVDPHPGRAGTPHRSSNRHRMTPMPLDAEALLQPISEGDPGGQDIRYEPIYSEIKQAASRRKTSPPATGPGSGRQPTGPWW